MTAVWWLMWRELSNRKVSFWVGIAMVSAAVALYAGIELMLRAREVAVAAQIDHMGPAIRLVPVGKTAGDLARFDLGSQYFRRTDAAGLRRRLDGQMRVLDQRLVSQVRLEGAMTPAIGVLPSEVITPFEVLRRLSDTEVALGSELAAKIGKTEGGDIVLGERPLRIVAVLPQTVSADDLALFVPLHSLQELLGLGDLVNEIRVFPAPGVGMASILSRLRSGGLGVSMVVADRDETAQSGMHQSLSRHRHVLYAVVALVVALCVGIWSYLNAAERKFEIATVIALGGTRTTVLGVLVGKAILLGLLGALLGYVAGAAITMLQDFSASIQVIGSWTLPLIVLGGTVGLSVLGALPAAIASVSRDHVVLLQE